MLPAPAKVDGEKGAVTSSNSTGTGAELPRENPVMATRRTSLGGVLPTSPMSVATPSTVTDLLCIRRLMRGKSTG